MAFAKIILNGDVLMDVTSDTVEASKLLSTYTATKNDGTKISGSYVPPSPVISSLSVTPTETAQTFNAAAVSGYKPVTVNAISSNYIGSAIPLKSAADLTVSGSTVTAPIGYYSSAVGKNVGAGSAIPPAVTITTNPTVTISSTTGIVTATYAGSSTVTPTVTAGYISQGTAGTISTAGTKTLQLTSKAAATINTSTADQTIASYRWLTGTQTIKSVTTSNITADNIRSGVVVQVGDANNASRITQVTGTYQPSPTISALTVTPTETQQTFNAAAVDGYKPVTVSAIPSAYIIPSGTSNITSNGTYDIASYQSVSVSVAGGGEFYETYRSIALVSVLECSNSEVQSFLSGVSIISSYMFAGRAFASSSSDGRIVFSACSKLYGYGMAYLQRAYNNTGYTAKFCFPSLTEMFAHAFQGGLGLDAIECPILSSIGTYAFASCTNLKSVSFPAVTSISGSAFESCAFITSVHFPSCVTLGSCAFRACSRLTEAIFSECVSVSYGAFIACSSLNTVNFQKLQFMESYVFSGCIKLQQVNLPECVMVNSYAFQRCISLSGVSLPKCSVIYGYAFQSCSSLSEISLPKCSVISNFAFRSCYNLLSLYLTGSSICTLESTFAFASTPIWSTTASTGGVYGSIYVPSSLYDQYISATNWSLFSSRFVSI